MERNHHLIIVYTLIALVAAWLLYMQIIDRSEQQSGVWQCSNVVCSQSVGPEAWVQKNCFTAPGENGTQIPVCRVVVNGQSQIVPLSALNLTNVRECIEYTCVQEVNVRTTNYTINVTSS